jgi:dipeptidyl aminopeptidase/acylaminoacyl peptidase
MVIGMLSARIWNNSKNLESHLKILIVVPMKRYIFLLLFTSGISVHADWLTPELLWKLGRVTDAQLSPDGNFVTYNVRRFNMEANTGNTDIMLYDVANNTVKPIADETGNETQPRWSNDGKRIFYLNDKEGTNQLYSMKADGSDKQQVSKLSTDINAFGISGDGKTLWIAQDVLLDNFYGNNKYKDLPKTTGHVYTDLMMRHWNQWADGTYSHILIAPLKDGKLDETPLDIMKDEHYDSPTKPDGGDEEIQWSNDGKQLAYTCIKSTGLAYATTTNSDIFVYNVGTKLTKNISESNKGYDKVPAFSPDGSRLAWISWEEPNAESSLQRLFVTDLKTGGKTNLSTGFEYNVTSIHWSGNSNRIYFISDIDATDEIFFADLTTGAKTVMNRLTHDNCDYTGLSVSTVNGVDRIIGTRMSISSPADIYSVDEATGTSARLTDTNKELLFGITLGEVKKFMVKTTDGKEMLTWVIYPPNFNPKNKYPTLLYCQGGPQNTVSQFFSYRWNFQLMAANGYIVVAPNRRGLPGFGKQWNDQISIDWGGQAMNDLLSSIDSISKHPYVNKDRMGAVGASFGGYSVYWLEGHHNKRFKAFISHCGTFNLESMMATEELFFHLHEFDGAYWRSPKPESYQKFSPHNYVNNWDTPILIIANERDYRVPYTQGLEAYSAARLKNIPARFLSFPDEGHWVLKPQNGLMWQREFYDFLDKYLKN